MDENSADLPDLLRVALGYAPTRWRAHWHALFALDHRLAKLVSSTNEPMLAQIKLAWWRDRLSESVEQRPNGDIVLDGLAVWDRSEASLTALVHAWEVIVTDELTTDNVREYIACRAEPIAAIAKLSGLDDLREPASQAGQRWALSDLVSHLSDAGERAELLQAFAEQQLEKSIRWPAAMRPLAVLSALANRHLSSPEKPILSRRRDALIALRAGMFGR